MKPRRLPFLWLAVGVLVPSLFFSGCVRNPATHKVHARLLSPESERKIGEEAKKEILKEYKVLKSTSVTAYVNSVGQKLAQVCDRPTVAYDFTVLDNDLINAFAVPGGFIFVTRGLLEQIDDEAELAMVLGHEIGHVAALHGVQMIQKEMGQNALTILGTIGAAFTLGPEAMLMVANTSSLFSSLYMLGYSRDKELEADRLGLQYMLRAGYDPQAALRFFKQLQKSEDEDAKGWDLYFRTHPNTSERIAIIESLIGAGQADAERSHVAEYQEIKSQLPRTNEAQRGKVDGLHYSNSLYHLELTVPSNWEYDRSVAQSLISFRTLDKQGEGRLQLVDLSSTSFTAQDASLQFAKDAGYQVVGGHQVLYQAGYGYFGHYVGVSPGGKALDMRTFTTLRRGIAYILIAGGPIDRSDNYILDLEAILRSLRFQS